MTILHLISWKKFIICTILIVAISPSFTQGNALTVPVNINKINKLGSSTTTNSVLTIERRINSTSAVVNESIIVELILTNVGDNPIYNINLTESMVQNPDIITSNLVSPMLFSKFEPNEQRIISYTITSLKVTNITLSSTIATYQLTNNLNSQIYTSYSKTDLISVKAKVITGNEANLNNLMVVAVLALFYTVILIVRILFKLSKKNKQTS